MIAETRRILRLLYCAGRLPDGRDCRQPIGEFAVGSRARIRCLRCKLQNLIDVGERDGEIVVWHEMVVTKR